MVNRSFPLVLFSFFLTVITSLADTLIVTTTADTGIGSSRKAILDANANSLPDDIIFNIPGSGIIGVYSFRPATSPSCARSPSTPSNSIRPCRAKKATPCPCVAANTWHPAPPTTSPPSSNPQPYPFRCVCRASKVFFLEPVRQFCIIAIMCHCGG